MFANAMEKGTETNYFFDEFEVDFVKRKLLKRGQVVHLKPKTFDLLLTLIERSGEVLSKNDLLDTVWEGSFVEENNLTVHIAALRKALGETKDNHRFIITVPGRGYRFIGELNAPLSAPKNSLPELNDPLADEFIIETQKVERITVQEDFSETPPVRAALPEAANSNAFAKKRRTVFAALIVFAVLIAAGYFLLKKKTNGFAASPDFSLRRLTSNGAVRAAALSPDGKFFVYSQDKGSQNSIWLGNVDGGEPIILRQFTETSIVSVNFAPDAGSIFYVIVDKQHPRGELYKISIFGGVAEKLRDNINSPVIPSPDGKRFIYVRNDKENDKSALVLADLNSTDERELAVRSFAHRFATFSLSFSPDGATIFFGAVGDDTTFIQLFTASVADGKVQPLSDDKWNFVRGTTWLEDGSGILLVGEEKNLEDGRWQIYHVSYPDGAARQFSPNLDSYGSSLTLSADGKTMLAIHEKLVSNVWVAPVDDLNQAKQITFGSVGRQDGWGGLDWGANGKFVYAAVEDRTKTIWTMDANGENQKQLIPKGGENLYPRISGDNRYIVFQSSRSGQPAVWRANADGGEMKQLTESPSGEPSISPDGNQVVYAVNPENSGELRRISINGGESIRLTENSAEWGQISPDGKLVACQYQDGGKTKLAVLSIDGGKPLKLFDVSPNTVFRSGIRWTADGKAVSYRDWYDGIWLQNLEANAPEKLKGLPHEKLYAFDWSPDGKQFAYTRGSEIRDVILISDFR